MVSETTQRVSATEASEQIADLRPEIPRFRQPDLYFELPAGHPRILRDFKQGKLYASAYCPVEIPRVIKRTIKSLSHDEEVKNILTSPIPQTESDEDLRRLLEIWLTVFDNCFFAGTVRRASVELVLINNPSVRVVGLYSDLKIFINRHDGFWKYENISRNEELLAILLHEMLHAFIEIHRCRQSCCTDPQGLLHACNGGLGHVTFHGPAFADSFVLMKEALESTVKWPISWTHIGECIIDSLFYDQWQPDIAQIHRYNLAPEFFSEPDIWFPRLEAIHGPFDNPKVYLALSLSDLAGEDVAVDEDS